MPIERNGRHWCNPAAEKPNAKGLWKCPGCGHVWQWWPEESTWADKGVDLKELLAPVIAAEEESGDK